MNFTWKLSEPRSSSLHQRRRRLWVLVEDLGDETYAKNRIFGEVEEEVYPATSSTHSSTGVYTTTTTSFFMAGTVMYRWKVFKQGVRTYWARNDPDTQGTTYSLEEAMALTVANARFD